LINIFTRYEHIVITLGDIVTLTYDLE